MSDFRTTVQSGAALERPLRGTTEDDGLKELVASICGPEALTSRAFCDTISSRATELRSSSNRMFEVDSPDGSSVHSLANERLIPPSQEAESIAAPLVHVSKPSRVRGSGFRTGASDTSSTSTDATDITDYSSHAVAGGPTVFNLSQSVACAGAAHGSNTATQSASPFPSLSSTPECRRAFLRLVENLLYRGALLPNSFVDERDGEKRTLLIAALCEGIQREQEYQSVSLPLSRRSAESSSRTLVSRWDCVTQAVRDVLSVLCAAWSVRKHNKRKATLPCSHDQEPSPTGDPSQSSETEITEADGEGRMPNHFDLVELLLCFGASLHAKSQTGKYPLQVAIERRSLKVSDPRVAPESAFQQDSSERQWTANTETEVFQRLSCFGATSLAAKQ